MTSMPIRSLTTGILLVLFIALPQARAETDKTPRQLIETLGVDVRQILEARKPDKTPEDAERAVAAQITALSQASPGHLSLTEVDQHGHTPLMLAASGGYPLVVAALLADPAVKLRINVRDEDGATVWMHASFAPTLTLAACQPGVLTAERSVLLPPYLRRMGHLLKTQGTAIGAVIRQLEEADAVQEPDEAKRVWLARCPNAAPELRAALAQGELMSTLIKQAVSRQSAFNKAALANIANVPARPPADMKFIAGTPVERPISKLLSVDEMACLRRPLPPVPNMEWSGEILLEVILQTRAGVVEAADFRVLGKPPETRVVEAFREVLLGTLSGYQCLGDHVFKQEFQFKFD